MINLLSLDVRLMILQRSGGNGERRWKEKQKTDAQVSANGDAATVAAEMVTNKLAGVHIDEHSGENRVHHANKGSTAIWKPKSYGTASGGAATEVENTPVSKVTVDGSGVGADVASNQKSSSGSAGLSKLFGGNLLENFTVDNSTYANARIRATFYPKFENEKSDQEVYFPTLVFFCFAFLIGPYIFGSCGVIVRSVFLVCMFFLHSCCLNFGLRGY